jgi:hypothetical protein
MNFENFAETDGKYKSNSGYHLGNTTLDLILTSQHIFQLQNIYFYCVDYLEMKEM